MCSGGEFRAAPVPRGANWVVGQEVGLDLLGPAPGVRHGWLAMRPAIAALAFVVALVAVGVPVAGHLYSRPLATVAYLSVDINPSFEVGVDARGRTSSVTALNDDAAKLILGRSFSGPAQKVIATLVSLSVAAGYLGTPDALVIITSSPAPVRTPTVQVNSQPAGAGAGAATAVAERVLADAKASVEATLARQKRTNPVQGLKVDAETRDEAHNAGLSQGKFAILLAAQNENLPVTVEDLKSGSVTQAIKNAGGQVGEVVGKAARVKDFRPLAQEYRDKSSVPVKNGKDKNKEQDKDQSKEQGEEQGKEQGKEPGKVQTAPAPGKDDGQPPRPALPAKPEGDQEEGQGTNPEPDTKSGSKKDGAPESRPGTGNDAGRRNPQGGR